MFCPDTEAAVAPLIIPTRYKAKIGKELSYPLGAEVLSRALAGLPMFAHLSIWFGSGSSTPRKICTETQNRVVSVAYSCTRSFTMSFGPSWTIRVTAVPRETRAQIKEMLLESGLEQIRTWLEKKANVWGSDGHVQLDVNWNSSTHQLVFDEIVEAGPHIAGKPR
jgi:hypothetical protein